MGPIQVPHLPRLVRADFLEDYTGKVGWHYQGGGLQDLERLKAGQGEGHFSLKLGFLFIEWTHGPAVMVQYTSAGRARRWRLRAGGTSLCLLSHSLPICLHLLRLA